MSQTTIHLRHHPVYPFAHGVCILALLLASGCAAGRARVTGGEQASLPQASLPQASCPQASRPQAAPVQQAVRQLASEDFKTRAGATQALIAEGDNALPALGRAGDMPVRVGGGLQVSATRSVVRAILGNSGDDVLIEHLGSPWANVRREAAAELGQRDRWSAVPRLIDHLEDDDVEVRAASASALRRVTNNFFGYRALASTKRRRATADRWRTWWSLEGSTRAGRPQLGVRLEVPTAR